MLKIDIDEMRYKYKHGVYSVEQMVNFVKYKVISKEQFFEITRLHYDGVIDNRNL